MAETPKIIIIAAPPAPPGSAVQTRARELARELSLPVVERAEVDPDCLYLMVTADGLDLRDGSEPQLPGVRVDFRSVDLRTGAGNLSRNQPLARAIGRKNRTVVDATAGLGHDAALLALIGYRVTAVERSPIIAALLADGVRRALADERLGEAFGDRLRVVAGDSREVLSAIDEPPDVVYLDPMYPPKRKSSALAKKGVRLLRLLVGDDADAEELLEVALTYTGGRVVVKRPNYAKPLRPGPVAAVKSKLVRYDIYSA